MKSFLASLVPLFYLTCLYLFPHLNFIVNDEYVSFMLWILCKFFLPIFLQKYVSELSTVRDCVETCVEKGKRTTNIMTFFIFHPIYSHFTWFSIGLKRDKTRSYWRKIRKNFLLCFSKINLKTFLKMNWKLKISSNF